MRYLLAQVNVGRLLAPLDSPQLADFAAAPGLRVHFPPPDDTESGPRPGRAGWLCPA